MDIVVEDYYVDREFYKEDYTFPHIVLIEFLKVMKTLNADEEFCLLVVHNFDFDDKDTKSDFSFMVNNSENLAGGSYNANEDLSMTVDYEQVLFAEDEEDQLAISVVNECCDTPTIEKSRLLVDLRIEKDGKVDIPSRKIMYKRLAEAFFNIVSEEDNFISLKAYSGDEEIFTSLWKK